MDKRTQETGINKNSILKVAYSDRLINYLKEQEGFRSKAYIVSERPQGATHAIGYGHNIYENDKHLMDVELNEASATQLLERDLKKYVKLAQNYVDSNFGKGTYDNLSLVRREMLIEFSYNIGLEKFPKLSKAIVQGDKVTILKEYLRKYKDKEGNVKELKRRNDAFRKTFIENFQ